MKNKYDENEAQLYINSYANQPEELALRVYTSRLIGREDSLVLHGGGNTSVKGSTTNLLGEEIEVIYVKGSGWDLGNIEPEGHPALDLAYLKKLRTIDRLSDEEMVNQFRTHLLDASSPTPSIETLVHAFLPHTFIDHSHADAIVTLTNQEKGEKLLREALGEKIGILPFIMPGFPLAKAVADLYESMPDMECLILMNHGIFTFGDDAGTSYERMIHYVSLAEDFIEQAMNRTQALPVETAASPDPDMVLPLLRGGLSYDLPDGEKQLFTLHLCQSDEILAALDRTDAEQLFVSGVLTPDHVIRTKNYPLFFDFSDCTDEQAENKIQKSIADYQLKYRDYFKHQTESKQLNRTMLDSMPRVMLVRGLGIVTAGKTAKEAVIAADIAEHTLLAKIRAAAVGSYLELDESSIFDMEYWSLEQAKLGRKTGLPLEGKTALVTGGGGAIAGGIGRQLLGAGARVVLCDINEARLLKVHGKLAEQYGELMVRPLLMDVTDRQSVSRGFSDIISFSGGLDILVPNAGIAHVASLADLDEKIFRKVIDVNLMGVYQVIKAAIPVFKRQGTGGHIIINSSKNVFAPGADFGAYSASKAGAHQLGKIAALELADLDVRVNMINADAIFDDTVPSGLWEVVGPDRMHARNLDPAGLKEYYRQRNLLKAEILADHVGNGVVFFASSLTPTTGATLPIDGGIMAAFPR